ncbi:hypothetical protein LEL_10705 [Akanthomyces lecanii RCEF 1005]|uniref:Uncharacterized protein n=1 Tax=Akanthomyces lecanii RCEF 1005 TaxID=1081108 RepID=A0A162MKC5_CORDF|nr:hypothetical protein LEL_10705 [Akanthomyces lecanii RCEF 1005]
MGGAVDGNIRVCSQYFPEQLTVVIRCRAEIAISLPDQRSNIILWNGGLLRIKNKPIRPNDFLPPNFGKEFLTPSDVVEFLLERTVEEYMTRIGDDKPLLGELSVLAKETATESFVKYFPTQVRGYQSAVFPFLSHLRTCAVEVPWQNPRGCYDYTVYVEHYEKINGAIKDHTKEKIGRWLNRIQEE